MSDLTGANPDDATQLRAAAETLIRDGRAELVALSVGERGAMLFSAQGAWRADALKVDVKSTTGAGDSFLAAMVWALNREIAAPQTLRYAAAAGSAACCREARTFCWAHDAARLAQKAQVHVFVGTAGAIG